MNFRISKQMAAESARRIKALGLGVFAAGVITAGVLAAAQPAYAADFTVTNTSDGGAGSLRPAMLDANANPGVDTIRFNIPGSGVHTIAPTSALPTVTDQVTMDGYSQPGSSPNTLSLSVNATNAKPLIELKGTNATGSVDGLSIVDGGSGSAVKGLVINRFSDDGVNLLGNTFTRIEGNFIGTDPSGTVDLGNGGDGVQIAFGTNDSVGGNSSAARNLISGNGGEGVDISSGNGVGDNKVLGNLIGTKKDGATTLGNSSHGVDIFNVPNNPVSSNTIAFNGGDGVRIETGFGSPIGTSGNRLTSNSIFSNGGLGIDLGGDGRTANDAGDSDSGANGLQNFPTLAAGTANGKTTVQGELNSKPNMFHNLQFFADPSGNGEGKKLVGQTSVTTDASGNAPFKFDLNQAVPAGQFVTATATNASIGDTSEFSAPATVKNAPAPDAVHPRVKSTVPAPNATGVAAGANVVANFSEAMKASTVNTATVKLRKAGSTNPLSATVTYDAANERAVLNPSANLQPGATYVATVTPASTDLAGNALDQDAAAAGNQAKTWKFTVRK